MHNCEIRNHLFSDHLEQQMISMKDEVIALVVKVDRTVTEERILELKEKFPEECKKLSKQFDFAVFHKEIHTKCKTQNVIIWNEVHGFENHENNDEVNKILQIITQGISAAWEKTFGGQHSLQFDDQLHKFKLKLPLNNAHFYPHMKQLEAMVEKRKQIDEHAKGTSLRTKTEFSDASLQVGGSSFAVHKVQLSKYPYFETLFKEGFTETLLNKFHLKGDLVTPELFEEVLKFIYDEAIDFSKKSYSEVISLAMVADYLQIEELKALCQYTLAGMMSEESFIPIAQYACAHSCNEVMESCRLFLAFNKEWQESVELPADLKDLLTVYDLAMDLDAGQKETGLQARVFTVISQRLNSDTFCQITEFASKALKNHNNTLLQKQVDEYVKNHPEELRGSNPEAVTRHKQFYALIDTMYKI